MILSASGKDVAEQAVTGNYIGIPYEKLDCQAFVERVLSDLGIRKKNGSLYNWRGSNSMWRHYIKWKGSIQKCLDEFGEIPQGSFLFIVKNDGGEEEKGYHDGQGNATHVGLYVGTSPLPVMDSQPTGGVQYRKLSIFTHVGLMEMIDYYTESLPPAEDATADWEALEAVHVLRDEDSKDTEVLEALKILTKYLKGE